jgi:hypothetical protein
MGVNLQKFVHYYGWLGTSNEKEPSGIIPKELLYQRLSCNSISELPSFIYRPDNKGGSDSGCCFAFLNATENDAGSETFTNV